MVLKLLGNDRNYISIRGRSAPAAPAKGWSGYHPLDPQAFFSVARAAVAPLDREAWRVRGAVALEGSLYAEQTVWRAALMRRANKLPVVRHIRSVGLLGRSQEMIPVKVNENYLTKFLSLQPRGNGEGDRNQ